jgi:hypothetical protein
MSVNELVKMAVKEKRNISLKPHRNIVFLKQTLH